MKIKSPFRLRSLRLTATALLSVGLLGLIPAGAQAAGVISDPALAGCIEQALKLPSGSTLTNADLEKLTTLVCGSAGVKSISGLEGAKNLRTLNLGFNTDLSDTSPLNSLSKLEAVDLNYTAANSIAFVQNNPELTSLGVNSAKLNGDIAALAGNTKLTELNLNNIKLVDLSPLAKLTNLRSLGLSNNEISDVSPIAELPALTDLFLHGNDTLKDISPLANLPKTITFVNVTRCAIADMTPLAQLPAGTQTLKSGQLVPGPTRYVPVGATTYSAPISGLKKMDGSAPEVFLSGATWLDEPKSFAGTMATWDVSALPEGNSIDASFRTGDAGEVWYVNHGASFNGAIWHPVVRVGFAEDVPGNLVENNTLNFPVKVTEGFPVAADGYAILAGDLPAGLTLDPASGVISGKATKAGSYTFTVKVTDAYGNFLTKEYTIEVAAAGKLAAAPSPESTATAPVEAAKSTALSKTGASLLWTGLAAAATLLAAGAVVALRRGRRS